MNKSLFLENGKEIETKEELFYYINMSVNILNEIRKTPLFALEFKSGNLKRYEEIEESLKLRTADGRILDFEEAIDYFNGVLKKKR